MNITERYSLEIQEIKLIIDALKNGEIYEIDRVPGVPKCSTIGLKLEEKFSALIKKIDKDIPGDIETAADILK